MRSMKRAGALTLAALILAFSLTACGKDGGSSGSGASSSAAGSTSSSEPITVDLDAVTDVFLTTAGIPGDTVVAQVGDVDITAAELLYWVAYSADSMLSYYSTYFGITELPWDTEDASGVTLTQGTLDNALRTAALYALIPGIAEEEGVTLSQDFQDTFADQLATMTEAMGGEDVMAMYLWQYPLTPELYTQLCESEDLNGQLQDKYFGENGTMKPTDADLLSYIQNDRKLYSVKHILLLTQDPETGEPLDEAAGEEGSGGGSAPPAAGEQRPRRPVRPADERLQRGHRTGHQPGRLSGRGGRSDGPRVRGGVPGPGARRDQ